MFIEHDYVVKKVYETVDHPLFAALAGERLTGIYLRSTPYLIRGCCVSMLPRPIRHDDGIILKKTFHSSPKSDTEVFFEVQALEYFVGRLKSRELEAIDEVFSPFVFIDSRYFHSLKSITKLLFSKELHPRFLEKIGGLQAVLDVQDPPRTATILELMRVYLQGIYLFRLGKYNPYLVRLNEYFKQNKIKELMDRFCHRDETLYMDYMQPVQEAIHFLQEDFDSAFTYSRLPDRLLKADVIFDDYLEKVTSMIQKDQQKKRK